MNRTLSHSLIDYCIHRTLARPSSTSRRCGASRSQAVREMAKCMADERSQPVARAQPALPTASAGHHIRHDYCRMYIVPFRRRHQTHNVLVGHAALLMAAAFAVAFASTCFCLSRSLCSNSAVDGALYRIASGMNTKMMLIDTPGKSGPDDKVRKMRPKNCAVQRLRDRPQLLPPPRAYPYLQWL